MKKISLLLFTLFLMSSCVTSKKYNELMALSDKNLQDKLSYEEQLSKSQSDLDDCSKEKDQLKSDISKLKGDIAKLNLSKEQLENEINQYKKLNDDLFTSKKTILNEASANQKSLSDKLAQKELELDAIATKQKALGVQLSEREAELNAMQKENDLQSQKIADLENRLKEKDLAIQNLKASITDALKGFSSDEVQVIEKNGKLYISLSEKLLFSSGSFTVDPKGADALAKLAEVLSQQEDFDILVEGHTDNVAFKGSAQLLDNWDLSVKRATSVVRILTAKGKIAPEKIAASGRSEYMPLTNNETAADKAKNRRTEIILSPKLDKIINLLNNN
jgi:chemotaxis protein MotB